MRIITLLTVASISLVPVLARAQGPNNRHFGIGLSLGEPAGITAKYWLNPKNAMDFARGYGFWPHNGPTIYVYYMYNVFTLVPARKLSFNLLLYIGAGGKLGIWHRRDNNIGNIGLCVRVPFGVTMVFTRTSFDLLLEIAPSMVIISPDSFWFDFDGCLGWRLYF